MLGTVISTRTRTSPTSPPPARSCRRTSSSTTPPGRPRTQEILAEADPSSGAFGTLANYLYADDDFKGGDAAAQRAIEEAQPAQRKSIEKQLDRLREQWQKRQKQLEKQAESAQGAEGAEGALSSPFGGVSPDSGVPPTGP